MFYDPLLTRGQNEINHDYVHAKMKQAADNMPAVLRQMSDAEWRKTISDLALLNLMDISHNNQTSAEP
jgi:hypothetical protein